MFRKGLDKYHTAVIAVSIYVAIGYVVVMVCLLGVWCRPFHIYYDTIPVPAENSMLCFGSLSEISLLLISSLLSTVYDLSKPYDS